MVFSKCVLIMACIGNCALGTSDFQTWAAAHGRSYSEGERASRLAAFTTNMIRIAELQKQSPNAHYAPDEFADWTVEERKGLTGLDEKVERFHTTKITFTEQSMRKAMAAGDLDWVAKGAVTTPTSQGRCATCQDFSAAADIEGAWFTSGHKLIKLSEQEMIDCGGGDGYGMKWVASTDTSDPHADPRGRGLATIEVAPLANHSDPNITGCRHVTNCTKVVAASKIDGNSVHIDGVASLTNHNETNILAMLQHGPMSISVNAGPFNGYHSGIINCSGSGIDHAVTLVGYGTDKSDAAHKQYGGDTKYWKIKNSWGPAFGEEGYVRLKFGNLCLRGPCQAFVGKPPLA
jgi:C1A family cysteine protease